MLPRTLRSALLAYVLLAVFPVLLLASSDRNEPTFSESSVRGAPDPSQAGPATPFEWTPRTIGAVVLACVCAVFANSAGIGGGPFYVPLFVVVLNFGMTTATALSHTVVATSAIASSVYGIWHRSPVDPTKPLVDFDIALTFIPALLLGVSFGVLFNTIIPDWLQTILLTLLLLVVIRNTSKKALRLWRAEQLVRAHKQSDDADEHVPASTSNAPSPVKDQRTLRHMQSEEPDYLHEHPEHNPALYADGFRGFWARLPGWKVLGTLALWVAFLALQLVKSRYPRCSPGFFASFVGQAVLCLGVTVFMIFYESRASSRRAQAADPEVNAALLGNQNGERDTQYDWQSSPVKLAKVTAIIAFAGLTAGMLGIGGALIFNPFLLQLGVHAQVTASTSVLMILFSSSSISLSFAFNHLLNVHYAAVFAPLAFVSSFIGVTVVGRVVRKSGRTSIIVIILTALITAGTILTAVFGGLRAAEEIKRGEGSGFGKVCE